MDYVKGRPFFCIDTNILKSFPYLDKDVESDILIIGCGIDGAIANFYLSQNFDVITVDSSKIGFCCTSCATALLEYQLDDFAEDLKEFMSESEIVDAYKMGLYAIEKIEGFVKEFENYCNFAKRPSLMYTPNIFNSKKLEKEFDFRVKNRFNCELITKENNPFPFKIKTGIFCQDGGAELDPYLFTKQLIENSKNQDKIFENTKIKEIEKTSNGFLAKTHFGPTIKCKKIIIATGFNWEVINKTNLCERTITYSLVTKPLKNFSWHQKTLIQDANSPYHYLRMLPNNRIIIGGEDSVFNENGINEKLAQKKYKKLEKHLYKLFPNIKDQIIIEFKFCGSFGTTDNNLGLMGKSEDEDILYFISCGANGILNAMYSVEILEDILTHKSNKLENLFSPTRT